MTDIVRDSDTITRYGEDAFILVCTHTSDATFYYDMENQILYDAVEYLITPCG